MKRLKAMWLVLTASDFSLTTGNLKGDKINTVDVGWWAKGFHAPELGSFDPEKNFEAVMEELNRMSEAEAVTKAPRKVTKTVRNIPKNLTKPVRNIAKTPTKKTTAKKK